MLPKRGNLDRRQVLIGAAALFSALPAVAEPPLEQRRFTRGRVVRRPLGALGDERTGIPGVLVSNGEDVTVSDEAGRWQLPTRTGDEVFVVKPKGWSTAARPNGLPDFWQTIPHPSTTLPEFEFILHEVDEPQRFDVLLLADTQPQTARELQFLRDTILATAADVPAAFAINHGDVVFDDLSLYPAYLRLLAETGMPWHHCPGNHDMDQPQAGPRFATWRRVFGPCHYAFEYGEAVFILLNNVEPLPGDATTPGGYGYRGRFGERPLRFVRNLLDHVPRHKLIVLSMHIPLVGLEMPDEPACSTADFQDLLALLDGRPHTVSFAGHTHTTEHHYLDRRHGVSGDVPHHHHVLTAACGGWWSGPFSADGLPTSDSRDGSPKGFHVLSIDGAGYTTRFVPIDADTSPQMRISVEIVDATEMLGTHPGEELYLASVVQSQPPARRVVVNIFDGGPRTRVDLTVIDMTGGAIPRVAYTGRLDRCRRSDPHIVESYAVHRDSLKSWLEPAASSHVWEGMLPADLAPGGYRVEIDVADEYGRAMRGESYLDLRGRGV